MYAAVTRAGSRLCVLSAGARALGEESVLRWLSICALHCRPLLRDEATKTALKRCAIKTARHYKGVTSTQGHMLSIADTDIVKAETGQANK